MTGPSAEMPFLEHLEELRQRLVRTLIALVAGFLIGYWLVQHFQVVNLIKAPIAQYLTATGGKLVVTSPTEAVMITLKLALLVGLVLVSPYIIYQVWGFLSPALYAREKRLVVPALFAGSLMFVAGAAFGFGILLPQSLPILFSFQSEGLVNLITYQEYFSFVMQIMLAMGVSFEIPLLIMLLAALGIVDPSGLNRFRRFAIVLSAVAGAILSPGTDILSMVLMTVPILLLYEIGFLGTWIIHRRKVARAAATAAGLVLLLFGLGATRLAAQDPVIPKKPLPVAKKPVVAPRDTTRADSVAADSARRRANQAVDTATARRLGLPTAPRRTFAPDDSVVTELLARPGYQATRFRSDSATVFADQRRLHLRGEASTKRGETTLEADSIAYQESDCLIRATGDPALFDKETVLSGFGGIRYNTCIRRGIVSDALTTFKQSGSDWFLRGNLAQDSSAARLYASNGDITSCDLPEPHYHFSAKEVKWISKTVMVARPAVLYVRDVPVLWLPFIFQDARSGRRSGILIPHFGLNDIVRQNPGYNRQITNIGYYWAPSDYLDVTGKLDWYSNRYVEYGGQMTYRWLDRFLSGSVGYRRTVETGGRRATNILWNHQQNFDVATSLTVNFNYSSSGFVQQRNTTDPYAATQQITSAANFTKRYAWGSIALGGNRRQNLSDKSATMTLPSLTVSPKPIDLARDITWSPGLSVTNNLESDFPVSGIVAVLPSGALDSLTPTRSSRTTTVGFQTPLRFGGFNWSNSFNFNDRKSTGPQVIGGIRVPDPTTPDPTDSITVSQFTNGDFQSDIDWQTGINLPTAFRGSWKLQPSVGIVNSTSGAFMVRNRNTNGQWVRQGKRFNFALSSSPTFFGFFPGFGPIQRIRHSISPTINWSYSPAASVDREYAQAIARPGETLRLRSDPTMLLSVGLNQNIEGKTIRRTVSTDTASEAGSEGSPEADNARRFRILGISTSPIQYDFEQAKQPGKTGWRTKTVTNGFQTDLLPGFNLQLTHDLWDGDVGSDSAHFSPYLQGVTTGFGISGGTVKSLLGLLGLRSKNDTSSKHEPPPPTSTIASQNRFGRPQTFFGGGADQSIGASTNHRFTANFNYTLSRQRPVRNPPTGYVAPKPTQSLQFSTAFAPTAFWSVSWSTSYNITDKRFEAQVVSLERVLHEWRARFNFQRAPTGNFAFYFSVYLSDLPDIKFDYNQTSFEK